MELQHSIDRINDSLYTLRRIKEITPIHLEAVHHLIDEHVLFLSTVKERLENGGNQSEGSGGHQSGSENAKGGSQSPDQNGE